MNDQEKDEGTPGKMVQALRFSQTYSGRERYAFGKFFRTRAPKAGSELVLRDGPHES